MLIALMDEPVLFVFESIAQAKIEIEPPDAAAEIRALYDQDAIPYRVVWIRPNRIRRFLFGLFSTVEYGEYSIVPAGVPNPAGLLHLLEIYSACDPMKMKGEIDALRRRLRGRQQAKELE